LPPGRVSVSPSTLKFPLFSIGYRPPLNAIPPKVHRRSISIAIGNPREQRPNCTQRYAWYHVMRLSREANASAGLLFPACVTACWRDSWQGRSRDEYLIISRHIGSRLWSRLVQLQVLRLFVSVIASGYDKWDGYCIARRTTLGHRWRVEYKGPSRSGGQCGARVLDESKLRSTGLAKV